MQRPPADRLELLSPPLTRLLTHATLSLPGPLRATILRGAFGRAEAAFNRGDLEVVFAAFADDVVYEPPPSLPGARPIRGRAAVLGYWQGIFERYDRNRIANLEVIEAERGVIRRRARLHHSGDAVGPALDYEILQTTRLRGGEVVEQTNELVAP